MKFADYSVLQRLTCSPAGAEGQNSRKFASLSRSNRTAQIPPWSLIDQKFSSMVLKREDLFFTKASFAAMTQPIGFCILVLR